MKWLKGKKTYLIAGLSFAIGLIEFLSLGDFSLSAIISLFESEQVAILAATIRNGIG
jgi:hypothetical protein